MPDLAALAAEGRRLTEEAAKEREQSTMRVTHLEWAIWLQNHADALLTACERLVAAEQLAADLRMAVESANGMAKIYHDRLMDNKACAEQRCAELAAALDDLIASARTHYCTGGEDGPCYICDSLDSIDDHAGILREHDAALIEKVRGAILRECDLGPDDRNTVVRTNDIEDAFNKVRKGEL